jgi:hypothetical protein
MNEYTFPFNTCETVNKNGIAQPYSAFFNLITCCVIFYFLLQTKNNYTFLLLLSIFIFEFFHAFSHVIHIPGPLQINITHLLTYIMNIAFFYVFYCVTNFYPSIIFIIYMFFLILIDIYAFSNFSFVYYLATQSLIFISLLFYYYPLMSKFIQKSIHLIFLIVLIVILLFLNEKYNCKAMMSIYPHFPYHIIIEITGIILFYIICNSFYKL